jgi:hypothetical protein
VTRPVRVIRFVEVEGLSHSDNAVRLIVSTLHLHGVFKVGSC